MILVGDALMMLRTLPDESVHCCVTSPPYWGLRDYGTATWEGGDDGCDHKRMTAEKINALTRSSSIGKSTAAGREQMDNWAAGSFGYREKCGKCGARRIDQQLGLEPTPDAYVARLVEAFREVRRVLHTDGTLWLNIGDSYASTATFRPGNPEKNGGASNRDGTPCPPGLKPKDLCGIPWRVAFALQSDGWYLRSDIIWAKPNPMPESVTDRPTKAHEYVFFLAKAERYFYNADAIKERGVYPPGVEATGSLARFGREEQFVAGNAHRGAKIPVTTGYRNARSVWSIVTEPTPEAHFATFPTELVKRCILAGCPPGGTVLDPFAGTGTTGRVAMDNGNRFIGIELNPKYAEMARRKLSQQSLLADALDAEVTA